MSTISPAMSLIIPSVGVTPGPEFAEDINSSLTLIDMHDHTPGNGTAITPLGMNINSTLTLNNNLLTNIKGLTLTTQPSTPGINTIYESGNDLYFVDGLGNNVRITQSGSVAGTPGSIANLVPPASASFVSVGGTFVWQSNTNVAGNMDNASVTIREQVANGNGVTLNAPSALAADYSLTFMGALPVSPKIMQVDSSGTLTSVLDVDNVTIEINSNNLRIKDNGVTTAKIADNQITTAKYVDHSITTVKLGSVGEQISSSCGAFTTNSTGGSLVTNLSVTITTTGRPVFVGLIPDGSVNPSSVTVDSPGYISVFFDDNGVSPAFYVTTLNGGQWPPSAFSTVLPKAAGTYTFRALIATSNSLYNVSMNYTKLIVYEL